MASGQERRQRRILSQDYREVDKLLGMAEKLEKDCEARERWLAIRFLFVCVAMGLIALGAIAIPWVELTGSIRILLAVVVSVVSAVVLLLSLGSITRSQKLLRRDRRALREIIAMLREIEPSMAEEMKLNALARAEFRIRLSRFDIDYDKTYYPFPFDILTKLFR